MALEWKTEKRKISQLIAWQRNPRKINEKQAKRLSESFEEFGQIETIAIGPGNEVYNGHQRLKVLMQKHGADFEIDVRVSPRALTEKEREKLTVFLHRGATGEWDFDLLIRDFDLPDLIEWGFDKDELLKSEVETPDPDIPNEQYLVSECLVEIYCTKADFDDFMKTLDQWDTRASVTINIS